MFSPSLSIAKCIVSCFPAPFLDLQQEPRDGVMGLNAIALKALSFMVIFISTLSSIHGDVNTTTLQGPFKPVTAPLNKNLTRNTTDLPESDTTFQKPDFQFEPEQISVSLSYNYDSVWISWITGEFQTGDDIVPLDTETVQSIVQFGAFGSGFTNEANGSSFVYNQLYDSKHLQNYTSGIIHRVRLRGLKPRTLYQYKCGDPSIRAMSDVHYFRTMPVSSPEDYPSRIAVAGDIGLTYNTTTTFSHMLVNHPELVLLVGGLSYADMYLTNGSASHSSDDRNSSLQSYQPRWDYWGRFMQPLTANVLTMVVGGKHEIEPQADSQTFVAYRSRFVTPSKENKSSSALYYSFNAGGIHFVMLNPYIPYNKSSDQYKWLEKDLSNVNRSITPWLIASWYTPWYSTYTDNYREAECMRLELEGLLHNHAVDVVFNAQVHAYERSNRVYNYTLDPCGPVYITLGGGGGGRELAVEHSDAAGSCPAPLERLCAFNFSSGPAKGRFCSDKQPDYSAYRESSFGHGILEVKNETHALWSWNRNQDPYLIAGDIIYMVREPEKCATRVRR